MSPNARFLSMKVLGQFDKTNKQLSLIRQQVFSQYKPEGMAKARVMVLTNECIRLRDRLDLVITTISGRDLKHFNSSLISILRIGFFEILYDEDTPNYATVDSAVNLTKQVLNRKASGLTNAVLRNLIRTLERDVDWNQDLMKKAKWHSVPKWLQSRWRTQFGEKGMYALCGTFNQSPNTFIRVNTSIISLEEIQNELSSLDIKSKNVYGPFLKIDSGAGKILFTEFFKNGTISIQNPGAGALVDLLDLQYGDFVLDVCAAPGTKSLYMAEKVGESGKVFASDADKDRVNRGKNDMGRHGHKSIEWSVKNATKNSFPVSDKILIDVPCSGTGVMRRKPDIRWRRQENDIQSFSTLQSKMLNHMSQFLNPGGTLVYGTCSLEPEENWNVVEQFLKLNPSFRLVASNSDLPEEWINDNGCLQTFPHVHGVDGMFAAKITRT